ncbi:hypothetical protein [Mycobacterium sp. DL99]|uniref:hypothetical protein n=1 Tax=Mycobacterium sp. DL99 TaxID=2528957 RepID=UPI001080F290|nr:hypothetical protein [Mycobacterium sp. DL99]
MSLPKRLRDKIEFKHAARPDLTACWMWTAGIDPNGLGFYSENGTNTTARRVVWEKLRGPIREGKKLYNTCPRKACVNPNHMDIRGAA